MFNRTTNYSEGKASNRKRLILVVAAGLLLIGSLVGAMTLSSTSKDKKTADSFVKAVYLGDSKSSYRLGSTTFTNTINPANWDSKVTTAHNFYTSKPAYIKNTTTVLENGTIQKKFYYTIKGISYDYDVQVWLSNTKKTWLVDYYSAAPKS